MNISRMIHGAIGCLVLFALGLVPRAHARQSAFVGSENTKANADSSLGGDLAAGEIVSKVLAENERRKESLQRYTVIRTYEIRTHEGKLDAQTVVRMEYRAPDVKTFEKTSEKGSGIVRHMVFDGLMNSEMETASGKQHHDAALTPANYQFYFVGEEDLGPYHCFVLQAVPKRKDKYLFEGTIWIDSHDFAVAKIDGHPAKKPSFWVKRADFIRQYQKVDGFWLPLRDETQVDVKLYGKRVFTIDHGQYVVQNQWEDKTKVE
jgi:hypothetical protein